MQVLFLFASLGVINGFLLSIYLLSKKQRKAADLFFAGLVMSLCIRIGKSVIVYFSEETDRLILQIGLSAALFIGPFFYLYLKSVLRQQAKVLKLDSVLLLSLLLFIVTAGIVWPYRQFPEIWNGYMIKGIYAVWAFFLLAGFYQAKSLIRKLISQPDQLNFQERYLVAILLSMLFITLTYQFALFIKGFTYIWGSIIFSVSFYYLAARVVLVKKPVVPQSAAPSPLEHGAELLAKVKTLMERKKPYTNQKLKLDELAAMADMSRHTLSRLLNEEYEHGFAHFVKQYRVNEAKRLIQVRHELSLEGIGYESGFNSKSAFFEAFKKLAEATPAEYRKQVVKV